VIHAGDTPQQLVAWLSEHGRNAETVFRVPEDEVAATGLAPL
jgi:TorA maturation chaperone TorD